MGKREYGQYCGLARALEIVGERWAPLIIRDLLVGPRRFTDLHRGLPRIPTNILSARLREFENAGLVRRRLLARPAGSIVYELTEFGSELDQVVLALGRWGARLLAEPAATEIVTADSLTMAMRSTFDPAAAGDLRARIELRLGEVVVGVRIDAGTLDVAPGDLEAPDLRIETGPALRSLMSGELDPDDAVEQGIVALTGDQRLLRRFAEVFRIEPMPATV